MPSRFGDLIVRLKGTRTYEQLSEDCGGLPSSARIQQMATKPQTNFPAVESIKGLAKGLGVKPVVLLAACGQDFELLSENDLNSSAGLLLPEGADKLTNAQQSVVVGMVRELVKSNQREQELQQLKGDSSAA